MYWYFKYPEISFLAAMHVNREIAKLIVSVLRTMLRPFRFVDPHAAYFVQCVTPILVVLRQQRLLMCRI